MTRRGWIAALLAVLLAAMVLIPLLTAGRETQAAAADEAEATELEITFFDAGKADAILLTTESGTVLIDTGERGFGKTILAFLEEQGIERVDYLIITHFDQDHVGGAAKVLNNIEVGTVLQNDSPKDSEAYEKYVKALVNAQVEPVTVQETYTFTLDGVRYTVEPHRQRQYSEDTSNNASLIVTVENGENRFLFMGDAQTERIEEYLDTAEGTCDVLKVAHHGGEEPLLEALLEAVAPRYAVITSSDEEPESEATAAALEAAGAEVYLTRRGVVKLWSDGTDITIGYA